jgi:hypothetical protein
MKTLDDRVLRTLARAMWCQLRPVRLAHARMAREVNSGPLSLTTVVGAASGDEHMQLPGDPCA